MSRFLSLSMAIPIFDDRVRMPTSISAGPFSLQLYHPSRTFPRHRVRIASAQYNGAARRSNDMESRKLVDIVSFDRGFDRVATITRKEPDAAGSLQ
jgi:hypothetical protein